MGIPARVKADTQGLRAAISMRLSEARRFSGMTAEELGATIGISRRLVTYLEAGRELPRMDVALRWIVACDLDPSWLLLPFDRLREDIALELAREAEIYGDQSGSHATGKRWGANQIRTKVPRNHPQAPDQIQSDVVSR